MTTPDGKWDFSELLSMIRFECRACGWNGFVEDDLLCPVCSEDIYMSDDDSGEIECGDKEMVTVYRPYRNQTDLFSGSKSQRPEKTFQIESFLSRFVLSV